MSDPSAVPSALGIEAVEWIAEGGENLTVRVTGRWRRRRPSFSGQPTLVVEAPGRRYRFPAMPEPPSLTGAGPGMWRISFSVPAALAPELGGRTWLQFGSVAVPLPSAIEPPGAHEPPDALEPPDARETDDAPATGDAPETSALAGWSGSEGAELGPGWAPDDEPTRRAEEAEAAVTALTDVVRDLERDLAAARSRADDLAEALSAQRSDRRTAQQREHAERALRLDLARQLAAHSREAHRAREAYGELAAAEDRVRALEAELDTTRRRIDEAEQAAAAALTARERAEQGAAGARLIAEQQASQMAERDSAAETARLTFETALGEMRATQPGRVPAEPARAVVAVAPAVGPAVGPGTAPARPEPVPPATPGADALVAALRAELDLRAGAEAGLRARIVDAEARLAAREQLGLRTGETLRELRRELDGLRAALGSERAALGLERAARLAAEQRTAGLERALGTSRARSRDALTAIGELRGALAALAPPPSPAPARHEKPSEVEPERLTEALARLREQVVAPESAPVSEVAAPVSEVAAVPDVADAAPAPDVPSAPEAPPEAPAPAPAAPRVPVPVRAPEPARETRAWLAPIFAELVRSDPKRAGRLLVDLLPAQRAVAPDPITYDLVLAGPEDAVRVTVVDGPTQIVTGEARGPGEVDFQVVGDHAALARMIVAGPLRRRLGRDVARVRGRRSGVRALEALVTARLELGELHRLGVRLQPHTAMLVVAKLIDPALTDKESFTLAFAPDGDEAVYLAIRAGAAPGVTRVRPAGRIAVTVTGPAGALEQALSGERSGAGSVSGDEWPLALLRKWIKTAQSG